MGWLRRGRRKDAGDPVAWVADDQDAPDDADGASVGGPAGDPADDAAAAGATGGPDGRTADADVRARGPWDVTEAPEDAGPIVDLGALRLPGRDGMELRLEVEESAGRVIAVTVQLDGSAVQLQAFAAPRTDGIWDEIRTEIAGSVSRSGGTADEAPGPFGKELIAQIPVRTADGETSLQPARFAGIDGPRWFLRAVFHGPAAFDEAAAQELENLVRDVVVVRGAEAMAPRELLTLRLPDSATPAPAESEDPPARPPLAPFERGPEITEVR